MRFTILGASGFIGSRLVAHLSASGIEVFAPRRDDPDLWRRDLGHVIYCIGRTADFRGHPLETTEAHVCVLRRVLESARFESLLYLSSTRVYQGAAEAREDAPLTIDPGSPDALYNASKMMGESLCLSAERPGTRVARLSNVYGPDLESRNFLSAVVREALAAGEVVVREAPTSAKDYVAVEDVVPALVRVAREGSERIYNVASGRNVTHGELLDELRRLTGCRVAFAADAPERVFPIVPIERMRAEFGFAPDHVMDRLDALVGDYRRRLENR